MSFPGPWVLLAPSNLSCTHRHGSFLLSLTRVGEEIPLCLMERMGPSGSKVRGQRAPKGQERGQRRGRSVPVSGFEAGHLESLRDSSQIRGFGSWDQTARLPDSLWPDPDWDLLNLPLSSSVTLGHLWAREDLHQYDRSLPAVPLPPSFFPPSPGPCPNTEANA